MIRNYPDDITLVVAKWGLIYIRIERRSESSGYELTGVDFTSLEFQILYPFLQFYVSTFDKKSTDEVLGNAIFARTLQEPFS